jgi:arsenate reductase (thioredoxin)
MSRQRVLFLCTDHSGRSQMAEAFLRKYAGDIFDANSAGLKPQCTDPRTVKVMHEIGIDISNEGPSAIGMYVGKSQFQYLITVCEDANKNCPSVWFDVNTRLHWPFEDPARFEGTEYEKLAKFREVRNLIENKIRGWVAKQTFIDPDLIRTSLSAARVRSC